MLKTTNIKHLVIGSGISGLFLSIKLSRFAKVLLITKKSLIDSSTYMAQGGIASVFDKKDSFDLHIKDTKRAGSDLFNKNIIDIIIRSGPKMIKELVDLGINFDQTENKFHLNLEGGHSHRRILHVKDFTGKALIDGLLKNIKKNKNIEILENHMLIDLIVSKDKTTCKGAYILDIENNLVKNYIADYTYLCTGGNSAIYKRTTNPNTSTGDGLAAGYRAGCDIRHLEFVQFHPSYFYNKDDKSFLITEALRGEGAVICDKSNKPFMHKYHKLGSLAPRDIVARGVYNEMQKQKTDHVYLDITHKNKKHIVNNFPNIFNHLIKTGIDITKDKIPITPAAHYNCGGINVDIWGRSNLYNLYALGEVSCSGFHGANRLASNSLLESLVFADLVSFDIKNNFKANNKEYNLKKFNFLEKNTAKNYEIKNKLKKIMWDKVGIIRENKILNDGLDLILKLSKEFEYINKKSDINKDILEIKNMLEISKLTIISAISRQKSIGSHYKRQDKVLMTTN